jgi:hypothetical protein
MFDPASAFEISWKRFETCLRGKLAERAAAQRLTLNAASFVLKDVSCGWFSKYEVTGKWLSDYEAIEHEKAAIVQDILKNDLAFRKEERQTRLPGYAKVAFPMAGALLGGGLARLLSAGPISSIAAAALPAVTLYFAVGGYEKDPLAKERASAVDAYVAQLDRYKISILHVVQA